jgi:8-oxo-dGTP diphosphatase
MKQRATVVCMRKGRVLLVAKERGRWAMPGGRPETDEPLSRTAFRELREETGLPAVSVRYAFQFRGASTRHFVFVADLPDGAEPSPGNEIARCRWARLKDVKRMPASIPTKGIADLLLRARPMVERTAGSAVHAGSSMAPRMARAMSGYAARAPFAVSTVPLIASGENRQSNHLISPGRKVSGLRPGDGQSFPSVCSAPCQTHAASPTTDRPLQPAHENASKPAHGRRAITSRGDR